eukprot:CAMPEP_0176449668 /NCGR_PEP_ID=MMETSP0127-20121128/26629_1 /TAXON_ID=938130 /ORGANISM="Platyophrya macrostoma, Strain WH" /LENGTH=169 /DNA_ID=CAMNT_0017837079 /DNA_START=26 /DNA_END=532 /DNA_ORIENTATION=+
MENFQVGHRYCAEELRNAFRLFSVGCTGEHICVTDLPLFMRCAGLEVSNVEVREQLTSFRVGRESSPDDVLNDYVTWPECRRLIEYFGIPPDSEAEAERVFQLIVGSHNSHQLSDDDSSEPSIMLPAHISRWIRSGAPFAYTSSPDGSSPEAGSVELCRQMDIDGDGVV